MSTADHAGQVAHPDEIDTRPTRTPLHMEATSHCLPAPRHRSRMTAVIPPKEAEIVVVAKIRAAVAVAAPSMASVEPALKPYQPIQRIKVPRACSTDEWPGRGNGFTGAWRQKQQAPLMRPPVRRPQQVRNES